MSEAKVSRLSWDCEQFGIEIFSIEGETASEDQLIESLQACRQFGAQLVYWGAGASRQVSKALLIDYGGAVVDRRIRYVHASPFSVPPGAAPDAIFSRRMSKEATRELVALSLEAGRDSRFRFDPRMPSHVFETLYTRWIERSCAGEIADSVIEARALDGRLCGMITTSVRNERGSIGLLAVAEASRGRGIGARLVGVASRAMADSGAQVLDVVTQGRNTGARRIYEACGFRPEEETDMYHFWLGAR